MHISRLNLLLCALAVLPFIPGTLSPPLGGTSVELSVVAVPGLTWADLHYEPTSVIPEWGTQRVQVAPGYWVCARVETTTHGNGLLYIEDNDGECLRTRIVDRHAEDDPWEEIDGGMFDYEFRDVDHDGELELIVSGTIVVKDDVGEIDRYWHGERWDRKHGIDRCWYLAESHDNAHLQERPSPASSGIVRCFDLGTDDAQNSWTVQTTIRPACDDYACEVFRNGHRVAAFTVEYSRWAPQFRLESAGGETFVVCRRSGTTGTGVSGTWESWSHYENGGLRDVLSYHCSGYVEGWNQPYDREFGVAMHLDDRGGLFLRASGSFEVSAGCCFGEQAKAAPTEDQNGGLLFTAKVEADYRWDAFIPLDAERADAAEHMMEGASDYLVEHYLPELLEYAEAYDGRATGWLGWLRDVCEKSDNKAVVESVIAKTA